MYFFSLNEYSLSQLYFLILTLTREIKLETLLLKSGGAIKEIETGSNRNLQNAKSGINSRNVPMQRAELDLGRCHKK